MAQIVRRRGSPYWYARFEHRGRAYLISTKTTSRRDARQIMEVKRKEITEALSVDEAARLLLAAMHVTVPQEGSAMRHLLREMVATSDPDEVASAMAARILALSDAAATRPADLARLTEGRRRWARLILGAQGTAIEIRAAWDVWLKTPRRHTAGDSTVATAYTPIWDRFVAWTDARGLKHLHDLTPADATAYLGHLQEEKLSAKTIRNHRGFLLAVWNALKVQAGLTDNVWTQTPAPEGEASERRALTPQQIGKLFAAATDPEDQVALSLGLFAALRLGDVANLPWTAVRLDEDVILLRPRKTRKYGREVRIPLHPDLKRLLSNHHESSGSEEWVCPRLRALYSRSRGLAGNHVVALFRAAGIQLVGEKGTHRNRAPSLGAFHALRHTFISFAARAGVPQIAVRAIVGHSNAATTRLYEHVDEPTLQKAIKAIPALKTGPDPKPSGE